MHDRKPLWVSHSRKVRAARQPRGSTFAGSNAAGHWHAGRSLLAPAGAEASSLQAPSSAIKSKDPKPRRIMSFPDRLTSM
jgi:hypothetical protein